MSDLEEARAYFAQDRYASLHTGIEILEVGDHYAKCMLKIDERHLNALGFLMGGVAYTMADFTFAIATNFRAKTPTVTNVAQISYLNPMSGNVLYSESRLLKDGKRSCFYEIRIYDDAGKDIAVVAVNGIHLTPKD